MEWPDTTIYEIREIGPAELRLPSRLLIRYSERKSLTFLVSSSVILARGPELWCIAVPQNLEVVAAAVNPDRKRPDSAQYAY